MTGLLKSPLAWLAIAGAVVLVLGVVFYEGKSAGRVNDLETTIEETDDARRDREAAERAARERAYCDQLNRLPGPRIDCP